MHQIKLFKKLLMPCGLCAAVPAIKPTNPSPSCPVNCSDEGGSKKLIRPSELPIYIVKDTCSDQIPRSDVERKPSALDEQIDKIKASIHAYTKEYEAVYNNVSQKVETGVEHSKVLIDYLQEDSNLLPRVGAIGVGGLAGLIFGLRGGKFKRIIYTSTGALTVAAICYPKEAQESFVLGKHYANIGYNFIWGVKPGDENQLNITFPDLSKLKMPESFSEIVDLAGSAASATAGAIGSLVTKVVDAINKKREETESKPESKK
ncbi:MICOS complex subunit MIC27 isoform X2 [Prorops nasuta]|uniref:MICOS complex subunit MIC27 isoform X2 n=1 Tax=Prorops nasuta TaxID=863751 RepID=UPI0034CEE37B